MSAPVFRDPIFDGATDPVVIARDGTDEWWMFYTQRRPDDLGPGVHWVHGTRIGTAVSTDQGASWQYRGPASGLEDGNTLWAPEIVRSPQGYRMYVTVVDGIPSSWSGAEAHIVEYLSDDLEHWIRRGRIELGSDRVIDAAVERCDDGRWRLWYKNERDGSSTWAATSADLQHWSVEGRIVPAEPPHEGPNVFRLGGWYWLLTDEWRGLGVHRSFDGVRWSRQAAAGGLILNEPGRHPLDWQIGRHADAVVLDGTHAVLFYFTHPAAVAEGEDAGMDAVASRRSAVHVAQLHVFDGRLVADRDVPAGRPVLARNEARSCTEDEPSETEGTA